MERTILHCDCNAFFASVECMREPALRKVPMAVSGNPNNRHGIILAKNELAKKYKVTTAETVWQARKKCPGLVLVPPHYEAYVACSRRVNAVYAHYTDLTAPFGIDETYLDITGSMHLFGKDGGGIADELRRRIKEEIGITISVGVSFNKIFAKLGSDYKKPDATTIITRKNFQRILYPLPVGELLFVGPALEKKLGRCRIRTIGQLALADREFLTQLLGKTGCQLSDAARGLDTSPVVSEYARPRAKSVGHGMTFSKNLVREEDIREGLALLADKVAQRLRRHCWKSAGVQVSVRDPRFVTVSKRRKLANPTWLFSDIYQAALDLIEQCRPLGKPVRALTVTGTHICSLEEAAEQGTLFGWESERSGRREKLEEAVFSIRDRYGTDAVVPASLLCAQRKAKQRETPKRWDLGEYIPFHGVDIR